MNADKAFDMAVMQVMQNMMQQINSMTMTCDPDTDFANIMIAHHGGALGISAVGLKWVRDDAMLMEARNIVKTSQWK